MRIPGISVLKEVRYYWDPGFGIMVLDALVRMAYLLTSNNSIKCNTSNRAVHFECAKEFVSVFTIYFIYFYLLLFFFSIEGIHIINIRYFIDLLHFQTLTTVCLGV